MISQRCRHQGRGSVFNRCFTSSIDTCAAAWVTLAIPFLLLLCQDLLLILPQIADWYHTPLIRLFIWQNSAWVDLASIGMPKSLIKCGWNCPTFQGRVIGLTRLSRTVEQRRRKS